MLKVTQSLLSSWNYVYNCWEGGEAEARESFLKMLRGEPEELTPEQQQNIQNGKDFEQLVTDIATGRFIPEFYDQGSIEPNTGEVMGKNKYPKWHRGAYELAQLLKGAQFQVRIHKPITVNGTEFMIHGVLDALKEGTIYDIKFKNKSFGSTDIPGGYFDSPQHPFYFYLVPEARKFVYLVSDGTDIFLEQYLPKESAKPEALISEFVEYLENQNLMDVYREHWTVDE